jgi:tetratricopeptide (TPR) repeat protein
MDRKGLVERLKKLVSRGKKTSGDSAAGRRKKVVYLTGVLGVVALFAALRVVGPPVARHVRVLASTAVGFLTPTNLLGEYGQAITNIQTKVGEIQRAEEENGRLVLENAQLRARVEALQFDCHVRDATASTQSLELKLDRETASRVGRSLATINYSIPAYLLPNQLYTLGVSYFKAREDEKAAKIFSHLTGMEDNDAFKSPKNFLISGVLWYRLDNYELATHYFDKVLSSPETPDVLAVQAQARLWKALAFEREGKHSNSQQWLRDLIDHHPHSTEAGWVNTMGVERAPATED